MANSHSILIADGTPLTVPQPLGALRKMGYDIISGGDPLHIHVVARRLSPAIVVLGATVRAGGPLAGLRRVRSTVETAAIPVIVLANAGSEKQALLSAGADSCLELPVSDDDLLDALRKNLNRPHLVTQAPLEIIGNPERLAALRETNLLDHAYDQGLDLITRLAAEILQVPVALLSLVDADRQFFKSQVGLPDVWAEKRETPLSHSFCQWVVSGHEELVVNDARVHQVLRNNRAVDELGVGAYAGVPISAIEGQPIGSFCAVDVKPHPWSDDDLATLRDLVQVVEAHAALEVYSAGMKNGRKRSIEFVTPKVVGGFLGLARLLRRGRPNLNDQQRDQLTAIIERHSHRWIELTQTESAPAYEEFDMATIDRMSENK
jgi:CheY-like chemotaxis protein